MLTIPELSSQLLSMHPWIAYTLEIAAMILGAWLVRALVIKQLRRVSRRTRTTLDDKLVAILDRAITPILVVAIAAASLNLFTLPASLLHIANRTLTVLVIALLLYYGSKVLQLLLNAWLNRRVERESLREPIRFVSQVVFAALAVMIVLDNLGISLTAVWTTLGVGSVAVALALQDTLSNFFAGVYLRLDNPVRVGDYIKLESGEEGFVLDQGWRSARIRTLPNNVVVVPNAKLASTIVTNYSLPEPQMSLLISVGVSYQSDPEQIEQILVEEASSAAGQVEGLLSDPPPLVRFIPGFGDSALNFTLICRVATFVDHISFSTNCGNAFSRASSEKVFPFHFRSGMCMCSRMMAAPQLVPQSMREWWGLAEQQYRSHWFRSSRSGIESESKEAANASESFGTARWRRRGSWVASECVSWSTYHRT